MTNALQLYQRGNPIHNPDLMAELTREIRGTTERTGGNCTNCHPAASELAPVWNGKAVNHRTHTQANIPCQTCHEAAEPNHGRLKLTVGLCNQCHHQSAKKETSCATCHAFQADVYEGKVNIPGGGEASVMSQAGVTCRDCHAPGDIPIQRTQASACAACHEATYSDTLHIWQQEEAMLLARIEQNMQLLTSESKTYRHYAELAAALHHDRSQTVHNPELFKRWESRIPNTP
jgi:hypothetical protein